MQDKRQRTLRKKYVSRFYKGNSLAYSGVLLSTVLISAVNLVDAWLMQQMIDTVSGVQASFEVGVLTVLTIGVILMILPIKMLHYVAMPRFMRKALTQYKNFAFQKLTQKNIASFRNEASSVYLSAFSNDLASIEANYLEKQSRLVFNIVGVTGAMILMLLYNPVLTFIAIGFFVLPIIASMITGGHLEKAEKAVSEKNAGFVASLKDIVNGFSIIKSFRAEDAALDLLEKSSTARYVSDRRCAGAHRLGNHARHSHCVCGFDRNGDQSHQ